MAPRTDPDRDVLARIGAGVAVSTLALTASFVGIVALATGEAVGLGSRLPIYVLAMAVAFVATVVLLELHEREGRLVLAVAASIGGGTFVIILLAGEGLIYAASDPEAVFASALVFYFLAAGLIATGLGYWGAHHWRELTSAGRR